MANAVGSVFDPGAVDQTLAGTSRFPVSNTGTDGPGYKTLSGVMTYINSNVTAPAGTLTGTTLNATVVTSSLTSVGTIGTGTWQGTIVGSTYGGTGNAFFAVSGPTTSTKTFTFPDSSATVLTSAAAVTVAQGGTGRATSTTAYGLIAAGTTATGAHQTLAAGATTTILVGGGASALPIWTTATGSGSPVRATSPTLVTPVLGAATATTLTTTGAINSSISTTTTAATPSIDAAALLGQAVVTWTPASDPSGTFVTNIMRKTIVNVGTSSITGVDHPIAGYDYLVMQGNTNTLDLAFVHESKFGKTGTGILNNLSFYKPAIDTIAGSVTNITLFDGDMDLSGVTYTNAYLMNNANRSYLAFNTVGTITGATGNQVPTSVWPSMATGRAYFPRGYGSAGVAAYTQGIAVVGPPIVIPERTTVTKIGINVTTGVASSVARLGIYKMGANGVPTTLVLDAGTVTTATTGEREVTISQVLEAGAYHLCYQSTGGVGGPTISTLAFAPSFLGEVFGLTSGDPSAGSIDVMYVANSGALPTPFGTPTKALIGAVPAVYLKK